MKGLPPGHFGVVIDLGYLLVIAPLSLFAFEGLHELHIVGFKGVVGEEEAGIALGALFKDAEYPGVIEEEDLHAGCVVEGVLMRVGANSMLQQVDHVDLSCCDAHGNSFSLAEHAKSID